jgi:YHS domain-containing protein
MKQISTLLLIMLGLTTTAFSQHEKRQKAFNLSKTQLAIQGYDPVSYFTQSKPAKGNKAYAYEHNGITYHFVSALHKEAFKAAPQTYEPQYGGWCAYAMGATGEKVTVDPESFKITNGKLYLFYNSFFNNTLKSWNKDEKSLHAKADANWIKFYP